MNRHKLTNQKIPAESQESGFTILEVAVASVITVVGMVFLASLFTLAITQNRIIKQYTASTALAQQKMEEINAIDKNDSRMTVNGGLTDSTKVNNYYDDLVVDEAAGTVSPLQSGQVANYRRYWKIENDPTLVNARIISVRVVALQPGHTKKAEDTTLVSVRSW
jgi:Tfp pilus assembly protein PilV